MPAFTIETSYRLPVYRHQTYDAANVEEACRLAIDDDDWTHEQRDHESSGETYVTGIWPDADAYSVDALAIPSEFAEMNQRKTDHFEILLGLLKVMVQNSSFDGEDRSYWLPRTRAAIARAEAILAAARDPDASDGPAEFVIARVINRYGECDYLCGWDIEWGTCASLSLARALRFPDHAAADAACERARRCPNLHRWPIHRVPRDPCPNLIAPPLQAFLPSPRPGFNTGLLHSGDHHD